MCARTSVCIWLHRQILYKIKNLYYALHKRWDTGLNLGIEKANTVDMMRPLIIRSLRRSKIRKQVAEYLFDISPNGSYPSDIAYMINTTPINVIGALKGYKSMYRNEESLMGMDIIEQVKINNNFIIYRITDYGKKIMESFF